MFSHWQEKHTLLDFHSPTIMILFYTKFGKSDRLESQIWSNESHGSLPQDEHKIFTSAVPCKIALWKQILIEFHAEWIFSFCLHIQSTRKFFVYDGFYLCLYSFLSSRIWLQLFLPQFFLFLDGYRASWQRNTEKLNKHCSKAKLKHNQWFAIIRNGQETFACNY